MPAAWRSGAADCQREGLHLLELQPVDESLASVFSYLVGKHHDHVLAGIARHHADPAPVHWRPTWRLVLFLSSFRRLFAAHLPARPCGMPAALALVGLFRDLILPTLLPIVILLPATAAFGDELEDDTLPYLLMKPISRLRIVLGKYLATLLVTIHDPRIGLR